MKMAEQIGRDYAKIIQAVDFDREINPLGVNIDDMLARLDEFETVLASVRAESNGIMANHVCSILSFSNNFGQLRERIDNLEQFVAMVNDNLNALESSVDVAEEELNVTEYSLKGLILKPLKAKLIATEATGAPPKSNLLNDEFQAVPIYKSDEFFGASVAEELPNIASP